MTSPDLPALREQHAALGWGISALESLPALGALEALHKAALHEAANLALTISALEQVFTVAPPARARVTGGETL